MTNDQSEILRHALGLDRSRRSTRNYFVTEPVWTGWLDADGWLTSEGLPCAVTHWCAMLRGPQS